MLLPGILLSISAGCVARTQLEPALPSAQIAGDDFVTQQADEGVTVLAAVDAWSGVPLDLRQVTPVRLTITNDSAHPLRIRNEDLTLQETGGDRVFRALQPVHIGGTEVVDVQPMEAMDDDAFDGFYVSPHFARFYPGLRAWSGPFYTNPTYDYATYDAFVRVDLPTEDMVEKALPEGVLMPGHSITGFVYFENVDRRVERVQLHFELIEAETEEPFGDVTIPFMVQDYRSRTAS